MRDEQQGIQGNTSSQAFSRAGQPLQATPPGPTGPGSSQASAPSTAGVPSTALPAPPTLVTRPARGWPVRWMRLFPFLFFLMLTMQIDKTNVSFMYVDRAFSARFGLLGNGAGIGLLTGGFLICYGAFGIVWGPLIERIKGRTAAIIGMVGWGVVIFLHAVATSYAQLLALRLVLGGIEAFAVPLMAWYSAQWLPFAERGRGQASWICGISMGSIITPLFVVWIMDGLGWQPVFYISALLPLIPLCLLLLVPNEPASARNFPRQELDLIAKDRLSAKLDDLGLPMKHVFRFRDVASDYRIWLIAVMDLASTAGFYGMTAFGPKYITGVLKFPRADMSYILSGGAALGAVLALCYATWSDRIQRRGWIGVGNFLLGALSLGLVFVLPAQPAALLFALASATSTAALVILWSLPHALAERGVVASAVGLASATGITAAGLVVTLMGGVIGGAGGHYLAGFLVVLVCFLLAAASSAILAAQKY